MAQQTLAGDQAQTRVEMSRAEIEAEIAAARQRLASNIADLVSQVHPRAVVHNTMSDARQFVTGEFRELKDQLVDENGVRIGRVALVAAAAAGAVSFALILASIVRGR